MRPKTASALSTGNIQRTLKNAITGGLIRREDTALIFYDLDFLQIRIRKLISSFPPGSLHALAIKANPLIRIMDFARNIHPRIGVEAASPGEVNLALKTGYLPGNIVYDSPVKTRDDLEFALKAGVHINADNLTELNRIDMLIREMVRGNNPLSSGEVQGIPPPCHGTIGIRINPQVGLGTIHESSVAGEYSKFGVPIKYQRDALAEAFLKYDWLTGIHLHVGSQGCNIQMLVDGIGILYDFMKEIDEKRLQKGFRPISIFDIGGGLPVSYRQDEEPPSMETYVAAINRRAPGLFEWQVSSPKIKDNGPKPRIKRTSDLIHTGPLADRSTRTPTLITEFGRWIYTNAGWTVSRVEYVKRDPGIHTAMLHVGADLFLRECLNPKDWGHEYIVFDSNGNLKTGVHEKPYNLAGPLCFSGDILARKVNLPNMEEGDYLVIRESGSYTFSMWSRYNSRQTPRIVGYFNDGEKFEILKDRERMNNIFDFWQ